MHIARSVKLPVAGAVFFAVFWFSSARSAEPMQEFAETLRQRGLHDEAIYYLDKLGASSMASSEQKQLIAYELGLTQLSRAGAIADPGLKQQLMEDAAAKFAQFAGANSGHELAGMANLHMARILSARADVQIAQARRSSDPTAVTKARKLLSQAQQCFAAAEKIFEARLKQFPKIIAPGEKTLRDQRNQVSSRLAQAKMMSATVDYTLGTIAEPGSLEARRSFTAAADKFGVLADAYNKRNAGLVCLYWKGCCYKEMGEIRLALGCFQQLIDLPADKAFYDVKAKAIRAALECWTNQHEKQYSLAIAQGEQWLKENTAPAESNPNDLAIRFLTALAYQKEATALAPKDGARQKLTTSARQHVTRVVRHPGDYQQPAKMLLASLNKNTDEPKREEPTTFEAAYQESTQALEAMETAIMGEKIARENKNVEPIEDFRKQKAEQTLKARKYLKLALSFSADAEKVEDLNAARYYMCYLHWDAGELHDAAVLGEFLARRYPDSNYGRQGAQVALAAYGRLYESQAGDRQFETRHLEQVADLIMKRWPNEPIAQEATMTLMNLALQERQVEKAIGYLNSVPATSAQRPQAEVRAGQALWGNYVRSANGPAESRPPQAELDKMKQQAKQLLQSGLDKMQATASGDPVMILGVLAMAQVYLDEGQPKTALEWLKKPKVGPLELLASNSPIPNRDNVAIETYKVALRTHVALLDFKQAEGVMQSLEKLIGNDARSGETLTLIYIALGRELQQQLQELRKTGKKAELKKVSQGFEQFLSKIADRQQGNTYSSLNWVAETYFSLGAGFDEEGGALSSASTSYYKQAVKAYQQVLATAAKDPKFAPNPDSLLGVQLRLSACQRKLRNYEEAIELVIGVLRQRPNMLAVQTQAAETYQAQGAVDFSAYVRAIKGTAPGKDGKNLVWGWEKLAQLTNGNPKFESTLHQAHLNMAECLYRYGLNQKIEARQKRLISQAKERLWFIYRLYPKMGGEQSYVQYERLLKRIQDSLGEQQVGFEEFKKRAGADARTAG